MNFYLDKPKCDIKGIKKAVSELKAIKQKGAGHYGLIYVDCKKNEVWVDEFCDLGHSWHTVYKDDAIKRVVPEFETMKSIYSAAHEQILEYVLESMC